MAWRQARLIITQAMLVFLAAYSGVLAQPADAPAGEKLAYAFLDLIVQVKSFRGADANNIAAEGYGFVAGVRGDVVTIATADHVVRDPDGTAFGGVQVLFHADPSHPQPATLLDVRIPPIYGDLAVLEVKLAGFRMAHFKVAQLPLTQGARAWRIGKQQGWTPSNAPGAYTGRERTIWLGFDNLDTPRGSSGGPILGEQGLIGMVTNDQSGRAQVLPIDIIAEFFLQSRLPWDIPEPTSPPPPGPTASVSKVLTLWRVGSPHDGRTPEAVVSPKLAALVRDAGYKIVAEGISANDFIGRFKAAAAAHSEPDIFTINNWGVMEGMTTALGHFDGLLGVPGVVERLTLVYGALKSEEGSEGGWEFLVKDSQNAQVARKLALRDPECDPNWTGGIGPGEVTQMAPEAASAYLRSDRNGLAQVADPDLIQRGPDAKLLAQPFDQDRAPLSVTGVQQCSYWGNNRLRFGIVVLRFEMPKMIGDAPVLLILRNDGRRWHLLAGTEDRYTISQLSSELPRVRFKEAPPGPPSVPTSAKLLAPAAGHSPQASPGQRFGDFVWQPSPSAGVVAEVAEFSSPFLSRLFFSKREGQPPAQDSVSAGQLMGRPDLRWHWRVWSISDSGAVAFSETRQ
jgi:hypothetical protein